jgi:hypothetical protein
MRKLLLFTATSTILTLLIMPAGASAAEFYLRPDGASGTKPWIVVGSTSAWDALNDEVTESETPSSTDLIQETRDGRETKLSLTSMNIYGVSVSKAQVWYYTATNQPVQAQSSLDTSWQTSNSVGWHSINETITSQAALDEVSLKFRTQGASATPRQVLAAFLKIETTGPSVYWGAWMDGDVYKATNPGLGDAPWDQTTWNLFEEHAKKPVSIVHFGQPPPWEQKFSTEPLEKAKARGALPLMDMGTGFIPGKPHTEKQPDNRVSLKEINEGLYDSYFKEWAEAVATYKYPFFLRWGWEMNITTFKWGENAALNPNEYVEAWRHIHGIAEEKKATNITWVWCPNVAFVGSTPFAELYPGDAYVDWTCLDGYNKTGVQFPELFGSSYTSLTTGVAPSKPVMIGETATINGSGHSSQSEWIKETIRSLPTTFPQIKAFVWFNWNIVEEEKEWPWPIEWTTGGQQAFAEEIATPYFAANEFGEPTQLAPISALP